MLDLRFHLNSSPLRIILNLFSTISFSDSVDELDDELDIKSGNEESNLGLFSSLDLDFFLLFLLECFGEFHFIFLDLSHLFCLLVEEVSRFSDSLFAMVHHMIYISSIIIFFPISSLEVTTEETTFRIIFPIICLKSSTTLL